MANEYRLEIYRWRRSPNSASSSWLEKYMCGMCGEVRRASRPSRITGGKRFRRRGLPRAGHALIELAEANSMFEEAGIRVVKTARFLENLRGVSNGK